MLTELITAGASKESVTAQVEHIRDATRRLTSMVDHLISDAMADAFDISIRREPVSYTHLDVYKRQMLVAANAYYLSLASASAEEARRNTDTIEKTIPEMSGLADNDLQRLALQRLQARTTALREGLAKLSEQLASRTELLRNTIDASQAETIGAIDDLSVKMRGREQKAQETFDRTLADISRSCLLYTSRCV